MTVSTETQQSAEGGAGSQPLLFEMKNLAKNLKASTQHVPHDCESLWEDISTIVGELAWLFEPSALELSLQLTNISRNSLFVFYCHKRIGSCGGE